MHDALLSYILGIGFVTPRLCCKRTRDREVASPGTIVASPRGITFRPHAMKLSVGLLMCGRPLWGCLAGGEYSHQPRHHQVNLHHHQGRIGSYGRVQQQDKPHGTDPGRKASLFTVRHVQGMSIRPSFAANFLQRPRVKAYWL